MELIEYLDQQIDFAQRDWKALIARADELKRGMGTARYEWETNAVRQRIAVLSRHRSMYCLMTSDDP